MYSTVSALESQIKHQKAQWVSGNEALSLTHLLSSESFQSVIHESQAYRARVFTPMVTLFLFIKQVLNPDKSCRQAVSHFVAEQSAQGVDKIASANTGPYTKARQRFPEEAVEALVQMSGESASQKTRAGWKVYGREVKAFDGTTVKMADTSANQKAFPQHKNQKKGAGFPIARLLIIVSLTVGTILDYAVAACKGKAQENRACSEKCKPVSKRMISCWRTAISPVIF